MEIPVVYYGRRLLPVLVTCRREERRGSTRWRHCAASRLGTQIVSGGLLRSTRRRFHIGIALLVFTCRAAAQVSPPGASVRGAVRDRASRLPVAGAAVYLDYAYAATADDQGGFRIPGLTPGRHWIAAREQAGAGTVSDSIPLSIAAGHDIDSLDILLDMSGSIGGLVFDADRKPLAGITVFLLEKRFVLGELAYGAAQTAITDARGEYRIQPVPAGRNYLLLAKQVDVRSAKTGEAGESETRRARPPAYYPGVRYLPGSLSISLAPGENRTGADIRMPDGPAYCVDGKADLPAGAAHSWRIAERLPLVPLSMGGTSDELTSVPAVYTSDADGRFQICGLYPAEYRITAAMTDKNGTLPATASVTIADEDVHDARLTPDSPIEVSGDVALDSPLPEGAVTPPLQIGLRRLSRQAFSYGARETAPGQFHLSGLPADDYILSVPALPQGWYVKDATYSGVRAKERRLTLSASGGRLHILLGTDGGFLAVRVTDREDTPVRHAYVYLFPEGSDSEAALASELEWAEVFDGWASIDAALAPGKYVVEAGYDAPDGSAELVERLWRAKSRAAAVEVSPGRNSATVELQTSR
jgi:hypothetical protein